MYTARIDELINNERLAVWQEEGVEGGCSQKLALLHAE
jgi:hypothetical protein